MVRGKAMVPVRWALLKLAEHGRTEPAERVLATAQCHHVKVLLPPPGASIEPTLTSATRPWWPRVPWETAARKPVIGTKRGDPTERQRVEPCSP